MKHSIRSGWLTALCAAALGALVLAGTGCSTAGVVAGGGDGKQTYILADDPTIADQINVAAVEHRMVGDLLQAHVTLKSNRDRSLRIQYRFSWYDATGVEIDAGTKPYHDVVLEGRDAISVTSLAPSPDAKEFKIRIKKVKVFKIENVR